MGLVAEETPTSRIAGRLGIDLTQLEEVPATHGPRLAGAAERRTARKSVRPVPPNVLDVGEC
jgi:hypothetical protein